MRSRLFSLWLPVMIWMAFIFIGSSQQSLPAPQSHALDVLIKKTGHVLEYAVLGLLLLRACQGSAALAAQEKSGAPANPPLFVPAVLAVLLGSLYAVSDEVHQRFVPTRSGNLRDVLLDAGAVTAAVALAWLWRRYRSRSRPRP